MKPTEHEDIVDKDDTQSADSVSASSTKIDLNYYDKINNTIADTCRSKAQKDVVCNCNILVNSEVLSSLINLVGKCPECNEILTSSINIENKKGLSHEIILCYIPCDWSHTTFSSKKTSTGRFDINIRTVIAFREVRKGFTAIETFCGNINIPPPMTKSTYVEIIEMLHPAFLLAVKESMSKATLQVRKLKNPGNEDVLQIVMIL